MPLSLLLLGVCWTIRKEDVCVEQGRDWVIQREGMWMWMWSKGRIWI